MACTICSHPKAAEIDKALPAGGPSATARAFGVSKTSLIRHRDNCGTPPGEFSVPHGKPPADPPPPSDRAPTFSGRPGPGRPCETCKSPARAEIERRLIAGEPHLSISKAVPGAPSHDAIGNHAHRCIPDLIRQAGADRDRAAGVKLADHVNKMVAEVMALAADARALVDDAKAAAATATACDECGNLPGPAAQIQAVRAAAEVIGKAANVLTVAGKFSGDLDKGRADIRDAKQWPAFTRAISHAVAGCDACSEAVEKALDAMEDDAA